MDLEEIRQEINFVDEQMKELFLKRMELSYHVIENKKRTKGAVYVPEREQEILAARTNGVSDEYRQECKTFFQQMMEISRAYQYSKLTDDSEKRNIFLDKEGEILFTFTCTKGEQQLRACIMAVLSSSLLAEKILAEKTESGYCCSLRISGDFSSKRARAAILQIAEETEDVQIQEI